MSAQSNNNGRDRRKMRIRKKISGTATKPRMTVFRSNKHIYVQVIDDRNGATLASASSLSSEVRGELSDLDKVAAARKVGALAAQRCVAAKIETIVFDRNGYDYQGRVAAVAEAAREGGLKF